MDVSDEQKAGEKMHLLKLSWNFFHDDMKKYQVISGTPIKNMPDLMLPNKPVSKEITVIFKCRSAENKVSTLAQTEWIRVKLPFSDAEAGKKASIEKIDAPTDDQCPAENKQVTEQFTAVANGIQFRDGDGFFLAFDKAAGTRWQRFMNHRYTARFRVALRYTIYTTVIAAILAATWYIIAAVAAAGGGIGGGSGMGGGNFGLAYMYHGGGHYSPSYGISIPSVAKEVAHADHPFAFSNVKSPIATKIDEPE